MLKSKERQVLLQLFLAVWLIAQSLVGLAKQDSAQASANGVSAWVTSNPPYQADTGSIPTTVIVAKSQTAQLNKSFTIGTCEIVSADRDPYTGEILSLYSQVGNPVMLADSFIWNYVYKAGLKSEAEQSRIRSSMDSMRDKATATLIKQAQHVKYELEEYISTEGFNYEPKEGYVGKDSFSYLVKYGSYTIRVNSYVNVGVDDTTGDGDRPDLDNQFVEKICGKRGKMWRVVSLAK